MRALTFQPKTPSFSVDSRQSHQPIRKTILTKLFFFFLFFKREKNEKLTQPPRKRIFIFKRMITLHVPFIQHPHSLPPSIHPHTLSLSSVTATHRSGDFSGHIPATSLLPTPWQQNDGRPPIAMSVSCSNFFPDSDLLCAEDTSGILSGESPESSSDISTSPPPPAVEEEEESIAGFIEDERNFVPGFEYLSRFQSRSLDASAREESVAWILKVVTLSPPVSNCFLVIGHSVSFILRYCHARSTEPDDAQVHRWHRHSEKPFRLL